MTALRVFVAMFGLLLASTAVAATSAAQTEIEQLLARVQALEGAKFIRNGGEHTAPEAAAHLRLKWERQASRIKTAEDFIAQCGTKSSTSGDRYQMRFRDGTVHDSAQVLTDWLAEIRRATQSAAR